MPRRPRFCRVSALPRCSYFKPNGIAMCDLEEIELATQECEALRLSDVEGLYQDKAAESMGVSRTTFGRILNQARSKVASALFEGKALRLCGSSECAYVKKEGLVAVCSAGETLEDLVDSVCARAKYFVLFDRKTEQVQVIENLTPSGRGAGREVAEKLISSGVSTVIAGEFGPNLEQIFNDVRIEMKTAVGKSGREAIESL